VTPAAGAWVVAAPPAAVAALAPLLQVRRARQPVVVLPAAAEAVLADPAAHLPPGTAALLVVGPARRSPRRLLPGLWVADAAGRRVPVGWLPALPGRLATYAAAAARVAARRTPPGPLVILGQWEDRFLRVALRTSRWFERNGAGIPAFHWTADRLSRTDLIAGLACGPGAALYFGHGRPNGWAGYHGVRGEHFPDPWPEPAGALLTLCCENASRARRGLSFAEDLALRGVCAGMLAATAKTRHEHNRLLGPALCEALTTRAPATLAELVAGAEVPPGFWSRTPYRFIGDPLAPLAGAPDAAVRAARVYAPAPDAVLEPWPDEPEVSILQPV
jgi:hypothetical protein